MRIRKLACAAISLLMAAYLACPAAASGVVIDPTPSDWNTVSLNSGGKTRAKLTFYADEDPYKFYIAVETNLYKSLFAEYFDDQDAYYVEPIINPGIPAGRKMTYALANPFVDDSGEPLFDPAKVKIYRDTGSRLYDVTSSFTYTTDDSNDGYFIISTRSHGAYILAEKAIAMPDDGVLRSSVRFIADDTAPETDAVSSPADTADTKEETASSAPRKFVIVRASELDNYA